MPATHFPKPEAKPGSGAILNSEPQKKAFLLTLPDDLLLNIADHFLGDFLAWRLGYPNNYYGDFDDLDPFRPPTSHDVEYINLAYVFPDFIFLFLNMY